jgi:phosphonate metabolism-associated iron-containing alcohol dehydrogenase
MDFMNLAMGMDPIGFSEETLMWRYRNPVEITFGTGALNALPKLIDGRRYALVTYPDPWFTSLAARLGELCGDPVLTVGDIAPNPDMRLLAEQSSRFGEAAAQADVIVALGGGSVIDSAKVFAAAPGRFAAVERYLKTGAGAEALTATAIIAIPTTAGTGSEVTSWATVWDTVFGKKYSLARPDLYPEHALVDPQLMLGKPRDLTISTGLDALSHALESLWNVNANPVSAQHAVGAAREILAVLPALANDLQNLELRTRMAQAAVSAGLAFSNTRTAIAHSISYPLTLHYGVAHGIACSFTLPMVLRSVSDVGGLTRTGLAGIFGPDIARAADGLERFLHDLGVSTDSRSHGVQSDAWSRLILDAFDGERGQNFVGTKHALTQAAGLLAEAAAE